MITLTRSNLNKIAKLVKSNNLKDAVAVVRKDNPDASAKDVRDAIRAACYRGQEEIAAVFSGKPIFMRGKNEQRYTLRGHKKT